LTSQQIEDINLKADITSIRAIVCLLNICFTQWLVETYLRTFLKISVNASIHNITEMYSMIAGTILETMISSFIDLLNNAKQTFFEVGLSGFKLTHSSQYYTERAKLREKLIKLFIELMF
jgi:hypothetical protein